MSSILIRDKVRNIFGCPAIDLSLRIILKSVWFNLISHWIVWATFSTFFYLYRIFFVKTKDFVFVNESCHFFYLYIIFICIYLFFLFEYNHFCLYSNKKKRKCVSFCKNKCIFFFYYSCNIFICKQVLSFFFGGGGTYFIFLSENDVALCIFFQSNLTERFAKSEFCLLLGVH